MARIRDYAVTINSADTTPVVCEMPVHATGDLLIAFCGKDGTAIFNTPANWYAANKNASTGAYGSIFTKRAASSSETLSITLATTDASVIIVVSVEGQYWDGSTTDGSDALSTAVTIAATDSTSPYTAGSVTPAHNNSLVFSALFSDATYSIHPSAGWPLIFTGDSGTNSLSICYTQQKTAAGLTGPTWTPGTGAADDTRTWMMAIRDGSSNTLCDAYLDRGTTPAFLLSRLNGSATGDINTPAYIAAASTTLTSVLVNGSTSKTCTGVTWGTATADSAYDPYGTSSLQSGASSQSAFSLSECSFSTWDLTQGKGLFFGMYAFALPRDYVDLGKVTNGGIAINLTSGSTSNARAWVIGGQFDKTTQQLGYNPFVIQVQQTNSTAYAWNSTVTWSSVTRVGFLTQGYYGAAAARWHGFHMLNLAVLAGGTPTNPFSFNDIKRVVNNGSGNIPVIQQTGSSITTMMPLQFGGGDPCAVNVTLSTIQFPTSTYTDADFRNYHVDPNYAGVEFYGQTSSDVFKFTNTVFTSATSYYWRFNASHSANAVLDFSGSSVINATVTLRSTSDLDGVSFIDCSSFAQNGATLTNCSFEDTKVSSSGPADAALISDSYFFSSGTGHGIEIGGTVANISLNNIDFAGYAASDGSTGNEAIFVNIASGSMTINITGGGTTPSIRTAGATVTVQNTVPLTVTVLDKNDNGPIKLAQVAIYKTSDDSQLMNEDTETVTAGSFVVGVKYRIVNVGNTDFTLIGAASNTVGVVFTATGAGSGTGTATNGIAYDNAFNYTSDTPIYVRIRKSSPGETKYIPTSTTGTITSTGFSVTVSMTEDTNA